ncbi:LOG family protein [Ferribacterium limneticum]|uniref:LOG family protein n=1 Tax=Ferribacterium limneticum TaxID=76259 RepID=UPI001CF8AE61|nr:TIGR00730 family Rossman fold protein [Ferribacterium limneticum]UCV22558.1 TIGR00730 family Rossman fold protein [Ferribacterium limneticum]
MKLRWICVFCGARAGVSERYTAHVREFAQAIVHQGIGLVYGGASVGLMGTLADAVLAAGGECIGVIPQGLVEQEIADPGLTRQIVTTSLSERKACMTELSDAFVTLPGGAGTLDELSEFWTTAQLGLHRKPIGILNSEGYFDFLLRFFDRAIADGFIDARDRELLSVERTSQALLDALVRQALD